MGHRELCPCCLKFVTKAQLKEHAEEAERQKNIIAMGGDPTTPATTLKVAPITGNDIFGPRLSAPTPVPPVDDGGTSPDTFVGSPPYTASPPHFPSHSIDDDDFPPDPVEHPHDPPQVPEPPNYPSMQMSDEDDDQDESGTEDQSETQGGPNLEEFMDWEYLRQGRPLVLR